VHAKSRQSRVRREERAVVRDSRDCAVQCRTVNLQTARRSYRWSCRCVLVMVVRIDSRVEEVELKGMKMQDATDANSKHGLPLQCTTLDMFTRHFSKLS
jgi:hypothetical protein